jgi:hypothetical protein
MELPMKRLGTAVFVLLMVVEPSFAKMHKDMYSVSCTTLWSAVKDTLRNSGKYGILGMENTEMTATYTMGVGSAGQTRQTSVILNVKGDASCEMVVQSGYSGFTNDDAGDFKKRVDKSLAQQQPPPASPAKTDGDNK